MIENVELEDRIAKCEKILATDPNSQIFAALAEAYRKIGDTRRAQEICIQGLKAHPNYSPARIVLAKIFIDKENYNSAFEELKKAINSSGRSRSIDILESEILIKRGQIPEARVVLEKLHSSDPNNETVKNLLALIASGGGAPASSSFRAPETSFTLTTDRNINLSDIIRILKVIPRVIGVAAVGHNGMLLDGRFDGMYTREETAAMTKEIYDTVIEGLNKCSFGNCREILVETGSSKIWIFSKEKYLLFIIARDDVSLGSLKLKIDELFHRVDVDQQDEKELGF